MGAKLDELVIEAISSDNKEILNNIIIELKDKSISKEKEDAIADLIDSYLSNPEQVNKALFIIELTQFFESNFANLRNALLCAVKTIIPKDAIKNTAIKALGIRDQNVSLSKIHKRINALKTFQKEQLFYNTISKTWGILKNIDWLVGTVSVEIFNQEFLQDIDLDSFFDNVILFSKNTDLKKIQKPDKNVSKIEFCNFIIENVLSPVSDIQLKNMSFEVYVPKIFSLDEFTSWWNRVSGERSESKTDMKSVRSIQELYNLVSSASRREIVLDEDAKKNLYLILSQIKPSSASKEFLMWAEIAANITDILPQKDWVNIVPKFSPIRDVLWPVEILTDSEISFAVWTQLKAIELTKWINLTEELVGNEYLKDLIMDLPWKVWNALSGKLGISFMESVIENSNKITSPEMLLWVWKNKDKVNALSLNKLNPGVILSAIYKPRLGTLWQVSQKELRKLLMENVEFQSHFLGERTEKNVMTLLETLHNSTFMGINDRHTLIVKLARISPQVKDFINSDKAKDLIAAKQKDIDAVSSEKDEAYITSFKSYNEKIAELQDVINRQIPENTEAIATARAHGDLRENAEFAAAKERQKFLNEYRGMLERRISFTQPTDFRNINITDSVLVGSSITLQYEENKTEIFHILGAWDSVPAKRYVSYETELGKVVVGKKLGEKIALPDGKNCTIVKIEALSNNIIEELK